MAAITKRQYFVILLGALIGVLILLFLYTEQLPRVLGSPRKPPPSYYVTRHQDHMWVYSVHTELSKKVDDFGLYVHNYVAHYFEHSSKGLANLCDNFTKARPKSETQHFIDLKRITAYTNDVFAFKNNHSGVSTFFLSSARFEGDNKQMGGLITNGRKKFYRCVRGKTLRQLGGFKATANGVTPRICNTTCSDKLSAMLHPLDADTAAVLIESEYTFSKWNTDCEGMHTPLAHNAHIHGRLLAIHVILDGGVAYVGGADSYSGYRIQPQGCHKEAFSTIRHVNMCRSNVTFSHVFVLNQVPTMLSFYHMMVENVIKLASFRELLYRNPSIAVLVDPQYVKFVTKLMTVLGLYNDIITPTFANARTIYVPSGASCHDIPYTYAQMANYWFQRYIDNNRYDKRSSDNDNSVLLIKRTKRPLQQHEQVNSYLRNKTESLNIDVEIFDDKDLPDFNTTMRMFNRARLIIAPHGAGLSNIIFSKPGTVVVDLQCTMPWVRLCFRNLAFRLGMRYYSTITREENVTNFRCNKGGMDIDTVEIFNLIDFVFQHFIDKR